MKKIFILSLITSTLLLSAGELSIDKEATWIKATAKATGHSFEAFPSKYQLQIGMDDGKLTSAVFSCKVLDLTTDKEKRDTEMFHWLESDHMPDFGFTMTGLKDVNGKQFMVGDFKLHNVVQQLEIPITLKEENNQVTIHGEVTLDTEKFKLPIIKKMGFLKVQPLVVVTFHLIGSR